MLHPSPAPRSRTLAAALALSLVFHLALLLLDLEPPDAPPRSTTLQARLAPRPTAPPVDTRPPATRAAAAKPRQAIPRPPKPAPAAPRILTARKPSDRQLTAPHSTPTWSVAQKQEMNDFLDELASEARNKPQARPQPSPDLAERSLAMAREAGRQPAREGSRSPQHDPAQLVERIAGSPPIDPFSLDFYLDSLLKKLNRSASFVKNDPRSRGVQAAAIEVRINPDGSLKSFTVTRSGDQQAEIAFVKSVVERAVPFAAFPPDIVRSARSLGLMICIQPTGSGNGGFGFTRRPEGSGC
mgnify:FL=1